ncbi:hypothetical protein [Priestia megaterium]|uniref:hypothetical protein n=1 Tax=Priestia megaterium TaxID=1404 RepID=UPI002E1CACCA|nr:hypothetical protein [Priestia megaterium]
MNMTMEKRFTHEEIIPANNLRSMSQKSLIELLEAKGKLGLIVNNEPGITMMKWEDYDQLIDSLNAMKDRIRQLEEQIEDIELVSTYGDALIASERGETKLYEVENVSDIFKLVDELERE